MILTITANPAVDVTYRIAQLEPGEVHRVRTERKAGGKGLNVARAVKQRGHDVAAVGIVGGETGRFIASELADAGIPARWVSTDNPTRSTVNVLTDSGESTMLNEYGGNPGKHNWELFLDLVGQQSAEASVAVVSGSFPGGLSAEDHAALFSHTQAAQFRIFDVSGSALLSAAENNASLLKPNAFELQEATGAADIQTGVRELLERGAQAIAVSLGAEGMLFATSKFSVRAFLDTPLSGNPTGAGDAAVASFAISFALHGQLLIDSSNIAADALRDAVAQSAAAVVAPTAGEFDYPTYQRLLNEVRTEEVHASS